MVESIAAPLPSVRIVLQEVPAENVIVAGEIGKRMVRVDVALIEGRDEAKKAALIAALNQAVCTSIDISGDDVRVLIRDVPKVDMGVANGISAKAAGR
ncbi:4-oxalocrotonate tautomerase [compost metagenome]